MPNHKITARKLFLKDTLLLGMNPHMHLRGKIVQVRAGAARTARAKCCWTCRSYDFNWQLWYMLKEPQLMPRGSRMICTAHFDNSADNLANPDPTKEVTWGEQTWDEMMFGFYSSIKPRTDIIKSASK